MKRIISYLLTVLLIFGALGSYSFARAAKDGPYSGGKGTEDDPYLISTEADIRELRNNITNDASLWSTKYYYKLTNDIKTGVGVNPVTTITAKADANSKFTSSLVPYNEKTDGNVPVYEVVEEWHTESYSESGIFEIFWDLEVFVSKTSNGYYNEHLDDSYWCSSSYNPKTWHKSLGYYRSAAFTGVFDGNGHSIELTSSDYLFGYLENGAVVKNLSFNSETARFILCVDQTSMVVGCETDRSIGINNGIVIDGITENGIGYTVTDDSEVYMNVLLGSCENVVIPETINGMPVVGIRSGAFTFADTGIKTLHIPNTIKLIESGAFESSYYSSIETIYYGGAPHELNSITEGGFPKGYNVVYNIIPIEGMVLAGGEDFVEIDPRESFTPAFEIYPLNANELITISTLSYSDCINIYNNKITGLKPGEAVVCARSDSGFVYEFTVRVIGYTSLSIDSLPDKLSYGLRSSFDPTGLAVTAHKNNGESNEATEYTVSGYNALKKGKQTVTVTYEGCTASFDVFVSDATVGDANLDGAVSSVDSNYLKRIIVGNMSAEEYTDEFFACDINGDGEINSIDSALLRRSLAGALI